MAPEHLRDAAGVAAVFGFFAMSWFGWAQEDPPARWLRPLRVGSVLSGLAAVGGGLLLWRYWSDGTVFDATTGPRFGVVVGIEVAAAGIGAAMLAIRQRAAAMPAWVAFVVGVHLFPVAVILEIPALHIPAALVTLASVAAVPVAKRRELPISAVVGGTTGPVLMASALVSLLYAAVA